MSEDLSTDPIRALQEAVANHIRQQPWFANVTVITADPGDVITQVNTALGKLGICIVIEPLEGSGENNGNAGSLDIEVQLGISVAERALTNRSASGTNKRATQVIVKLLQLFNPLNATPIPATLGRWKLTNDTGGMVVYQVTGRSNACWTPEP